MEGCRRMLGVDGCFLKGPFKQQLLTVVGRDANDQMFPVAWAVVDIENNSNWMWFLQLVKKDLNIRDDGLGWSFQSDQHPVSFKKIVYVVFFTYFVIFSYSNYFSCVFAVYNSCITDVDATSRG